MFIRTIYEKPLHHFYVIKSCKKCGWCYSHFHCYKQIIRVGSPIVCIFKWTDSDSYIIYYGDNISPSYNWFTISRDLQGALGGIFSKSPTHTHTLKKLFIIISLTLSRYRSSLPAGLQDYTPYLHRAAVCRFELVARPLLGHVKGSTGVYHLWARPYFSSSVLHVWFV